MLPKITTGAARVLLELLAWKAFGSGADCSWLPWHWMTKLGSIFWIFPLAFFMRKMTRNSKMNMRAWMCYVYSFKKKIIFDWLYIAWKQALTRTETTMCITRMHKLFYPTFASTPYTLEAIYKSQLTCKPAHLWMREETDSLEGRHAVTGGCTNSIQKVRSNPGVWHWD